jgi:2-amino-4-hydroxy-6-hydroxymethyldihydropteridine diphosphokinase
MEVWQPAYVGVGSNLDDPRARVLEAFKKLAGVSRTRVILTSPLYLSRPFGPVAQPDYVIAVAGVLTQLSSHALLAERRAIETASGRPDRHQKWGPRVIDLDVLVYARERRDEPELRLPHPGIVERNFVLYPLADIAPELDVPGLGLVTELKGRVLSDGLQLLK